MLVMKIRAIFSGSLKKDMELKAYIRASAFFNVFPQIITGEITISDESTIFSPKIPSKTVDFRLFTLNQPPFRQHHQVSVQNSDRFHKQARFSFRGS